MALRKTVEGGDEIKSAIESLGKRRKNIDARIIEYINKGSRNGIVIQCSTKEEART